MRKILLVLTALVFMDATMIVAQEYADQPNSPRPSYGISAGVDFNFHNADFIGLPGIPSCCPRFETGTGFGLNCGLYYSFPVNSSFDIYLKAVYTDLSGLLSKTEPVVVSDVNGNATLGEFEHSVDSKISSVGLAPMLSYKLSSNLRLEAGFRLGFLMNKTYEQKEEITKPSFGTYQGTTFRIRNEYSGDIPDASSIEAAVLIGAAYDLPLNKQWTWFLVPEVHYGIGLTPVASGETWNVSAFQCAIGIKWAPRKIIPPPPPIEPPKKAPLPSMPAPPEAPLLDASIVAVALDENGKESSVSTMIVEENLSSRLQPLLTYVFFDENSSKIPERYFEMTEQEKEEYKKNDRALYNLRTMEVYHRILHVIGKRMMRLPQATLTLRGCNTGQGPEENNLELSRKRAESVKKFIVDEWGINPERITVEAKNLPSVPSNVKDPDGLAENRRVEISSNLPQIFESLQIQDTIRNTNPPVIRFKPQVNAKIGIDSWRLVSAQGDQKLKVFSGKGDIPKHLELDLKKEEKTYIPRSDQPYTYKLEVVDNSGKTWESPTQELPVKQLTVEKKIIEMIDDKEIHNFSLISFEFGKADLTQEHQPIIGMAQKRIEDNSIVSIVGMTDRIGEEDYNQKLSERRAYATARALKVNQKFAKGIGEQNPLFDNDLPEGRFYNRVVQIRIETPILYDIMK